jgi:hypothetical protein
VAKEPIYSTFLVPKISCHQFGAAFAQFGPATVMRGSVGAKKITILNQTLLLPREMSKQADTPNT